MIKQLDIFGGENEIEEQHRTSGIRYKRMQDLHGTITGKTCKTCEHLLVRNYHGRIYFKCEMWVISNSKATDIRLKDTSCGMYEEYKK